MPSIQKQTVVLAALAATVLALALAACAPTGGGTTTDPVPVPTPTVTVTPADPVPTAVILSLTGIDVVDENGATLEAATFDNPDAGLALLSELLGSTPEPSVNPDYGTSVWTWGGIQFGSNGDSFSWLRSEQAELGGLPLQTAGGIHVGSSRADVEALSPFDMQYDQDGDGTSDVLGLDPEAVPGSESLTFPGHTGTAFVEADLEGNTVAVLRSPADDFSDV